MTPRSGAAGLAAATTRATALAVGYVGGDRLHADAAGLESRDERRTVAVSASPPDEHEVTRPLLAKPFGNDAAQAAERAGDEIRGIAPDRSTSSGFVHPQHDLADVFRLRHETKRLLRLSERVGGERQRAQLAGLRSPRPPRRYNACSGRGAKVTEIEREIARRPDARAAICSGVQMPALPISTKRPPGAQRRHAGWR